MKTVYAINPGIASCARVENLMTGQCDLFIYMNERVILGDDSMPWSKAPPALQQALRDHFQAVFALPVEMREEYLLNCEQILVETEA